MFLDALACIHVCVGVCEKMNVCGWASFLLVCMQEPRLPRPIHSSFITGTVGGNISTDAFPSKALIDKANISKTVWKKITSRQGEGNRIPRGVDQEHVVVLKRVHVYLRVSDDYQADWEPKFKRTAWQHPCHLQHTNIPLLICRLLQLSAPSTTTTTAMPSSLSLVLCRRRNELSASSPQQQK